MQNKLNDSFDFCQTDHKAEDIFPDVMNTFKTLKINIENYRCQSYDNASEQPNGLQAEIKETC